MPKAESCRFVELLLTCGSWQEAQNIADVLLEQRLAVCIEFLEIKSRYLWHGRTEEAAEWLEAETNG